MLSLLKYFSTLLVHRFRTPPSATLRRTVLHCYTAASIWIFASAWLCTSVPGIVALFRQIPVEPACWRFWPLGAGGQWAHRKVASHSRCNSAACANRNLKSIPSVHMTFAQRRINVHAIASNTWKSYTLVSNSLQNYAIEDRHNNRLYLKHVLLLHFCAEDNYVTQSKENKINWYLTEENVYCFSFIHSSYTKFFKFFFLEFLGMFSVWFSFFISFVISQF